MSKKGIVERQGCSGKTEEMTLAEINHAFLEGGQAHAICRINGEGMPEPQSQPSAQSLARRRVIARKKDRQLALANELGEARASLAEVRSKINGYGRKGRRKVRFKKLAALESELMDRVKTLLKMQVKDRPFREYKARAWVLTKEQPLHTLANYEKRALTGWHVDHVLSIMEGYRRGLPAEAVAHISNLRMLPAKENMDKGTRTVFTNLFNETLLRA